MLFRRLAVFAGGCTLEAAEAVCSPDGGPGPDVLEGLASLVDESLLQQGTGPDHQPRFRLLETIREYALERLVGSGELDELYRRHAEHYLALAEVAEPELRGQQQALWLERLSAEHDNLRAPWAVEPEGAIGRVTFERRRQRSGRLAYSSEINWHLERRIGLGAVDHPRIAGSGLRVLMAEHVLHRAQVVRVAIGQSGAGVAQRMVGYPRPLHLRQAQVAVHDVAHPAPTQPMATRVVAHGGQQRLAVIVLQHTTSGSQVAS